MSTMAEMAMAAACLPIGIVAALAIVCAAMISGQISRQEESGDDA